MFGIDTVPNEYRLQIYEEAKELYPITLEDKPYFDQHTYLRSLLHRNDRTTMGASIECREPFLDQRLLTGLGSLEDKWLFTGKRKVYFKISDAESITRSYIKF
jgi:asparagine synthase (glutamine-hydrolysing)